MAEKFADETVIVTGSSSGIGRRIATRFAEEGANVVTNARDYTRAEDTARSIREAGGDAIGIQADMSERSDVVDLVEQAVAEYGGLDVIVNNAGIHVGKPVMELDSDDWRSVIDVNLSGVFFGAQVAAEQMIEQGEGGAIVNVSSIFGSAAKQGLTPYNASKGGVNNLTRSLAVELAEHDIQVNALAPGYVKTSMDDSGRSDDRTPPSGPTTSTRFDTSGTGRRWTGTGL